MIYNTTIHSPNGNQTSRPIVANSADEAMAQMAEEHGIAPGDPSVTIVAKEQNDPELERMLIEAEARRLSDEYYRMPVTRRRRR